MAGDFLPDLSTTRKVVSVTAAEFDGILIGEVLNMSADPRILTDGKVDLGKLQPIVFDAAAMTYRALGGVVGKAWGAGKKFCE